MVVDEEFDRMMHASRSSNMPITSVWKAPPMPPQPADLWTNGGDLGLMTAAPPPMPTMAAAFAAQQNYINGILTGDEMSANRLY